MNLSVNNVRSVGMASYGVNKNNNQSVSKNYEYDSYSPSFKKGLDIQLNHGKSRGLILLVFGALMALAASCQKQTIEVQYPNSNNFNTDAYTEMINLDSINTNQNVEIGDIGPILDLLHGIGGKP